MYSGIINNNGSEKNLSIRLQNYDFPYETVLQIDTIMYIAKVDYNIITLFSQNNKTDPVTSFQYKITYDSESNEVLIIGKEISNIFHKILCCIYKPRFFVLTNKREV